jgi:hypothetical protein
MIEFLQKMLKNIAEAKMLPDADMAFLINMENTVLERAKQPVTDLRNQGVLPPAQSGPPMGGGGGGVMPMPNMSGASSELGRMMAPSQGPQ